MSNSILSIIIINILYIVFLLSNNQFVRFASIEEDTPSYHRRYDFFVSKFASMCKSNFCNAENILQIYLII